MSSQKIPNHLQQINLITTEQELLLKQFKQFQGEIEFYSLMQLPVHTNEEEVKQEQDIKIQKKQSQTNKKLIKRQSSKLNESTSFLRKSSEKAHIPNQHCSSLNLESLFAYHEKQNQLLNPEYYAIKKQLIEYQQKSNQIYLVSQYIKSYEQQFGALIKEKDNLLELIQQIKGQTSNILLKQKNLIDLTIEIKEKLDYYTFHQKNQFNFPCEISCRQLFQDNLQSHLSSIMDGTEFFQENSTYFQSKKQLNQYFLSKSKILSFIKSFLIKLLNKQNSFSCKFVNHNRLNQELLLLYPKSRIKFAIHYIITFPEFKSLLAPILLACKDDQSKQQESKFLQTRQLQIDEFILNESNISLIRYLQKNNNEIYNEVILNLFSFNRFNYHQQFLHSMRRPVGQENVKEDKDKLDILRTRFIYVVQIIISEYMYFLYIARPSTIASIEFIKAWIYKLAIKYAEIIVKYIREIISAKNAFQICQVLNVLVKEIPKYFKNLATGNYQSYIMGSLYGKIIQKYASNLQFSQQSHIKYLISIFTTIYQRLLSEFLQSHCVQSLPKLQPCHTKSTLQQSVNLLVSYIPALKYLKSSSQQQYMISSLDIIIKSIKEINMGIESRFQCYSWNLLIFGAIREVLKGNQELKNLVSKQVRLSFNESLGVIERVKQIERTQSLIKYAQDIFNVIKTGMPQLNQLTLDFNEYINEHYQQLKQRFLKDILFIYGKNMIDFLQKVMQLKKLNNIDYGSNKQINIKLTNNNDKEIPQQIQNQQQVGTKKNLKSTQQQQKEKFKEDILKLCEPKSMKSLYNSYLLSIERYIKQSVELLQSLEQQSKIKQKPQQINNLKLLILEVYEKLLDFLDQFYIALAKHDYKQLNITMQMQQISQIKQKQQSLWIGNYNDSKQKIKVDMTSILRKS